jgi:hypothetical protein
MQIAVYVIMLTVSCVRGQTKAEKYGGVIHALHELKQMFSVG